MTPPTVVNIHPDTRASVRLPPIVHTLRQHSRRQLGELIQALFNNTDDALFELADRSESNADQSLFFESMRQIRLRREEVTQLTLQRFYQGFEHLFATGPAALDNPATDAANDEPGEELALLANDALEINVAVAGIISKVTAKHSATLETLTKRLDHVCKQQTIDQRNNPLGPAQLSQAFVSAIDVLQLDIRVAIILLKLFERMVMQRLEDVYVKADKLLTEAGILPKLNQRPRPAPRPQPVVNEAGKASQDSTQANVSGEPASAGSAAPMHPIIDPGVAGALGAAGANGAYGHSAVTPEFSLIQRLLAGAQAPGQLQTPHPSMGLASGSSGFNPYAQLGYQQGGSMPAATPGSALGSAPGQATPGNFFISTPQLVGLLNDLQTDYQKQNLNLNEAPPLLDLRNIVFERADGPEDEAQSKPAIEKSDDDALNIVAMLFDFILNDRNLAIPMKALISRLQIPFVKLAVMDKSFFERGTHPARQLLNELASAGIGWSSASELKRDALYDKIESIIVRVLNGFGEDADIFAELVEDLREFVKHAQRRQVQVEQRVQAVETGKAKTQGVKLMVQQIINQKASGLRLPAEVGRFVSDTFARSMVMSGIRAGADSGTWQANLQTLDDLLWVCQPLDTRADIDARDAMLDTLTVRLRELIDSVSEDHGQNEALLDNIVSELDQARERDRAYLGEDDPAKPEVPENYEPLEEITLAEVSYLPAKPVADVDQRSLTQLDDLREGGWVEMIRNNAPAMRCKLTKVIQPGDRYVFVNRRGMKMAEFSRLELARKLQDEEMTVLDESEVFDRALQAVVGNLRELQRDKGPEVDPVPG